MSAVTSSFAACAKFSTYPPTISTAAASIEMKLKNIKQTAAAKAAAVSQTRFIMRFRARIVVASFRQRFRLL